MTDWQANLSSLIKQRKPKSKPSSADACQKILAEAASAGELTQGDFENLSRVLGYLVPWDNGATDADAAGRQLNDAFVVTAQWGASIFDSLLERFPKFKSGKVNVDDIVLNAKARTTINVLLNRRLIRVADLVRLAKKNPEAFFASPALDVLVTEGTPAPRSVWKALQVDAATRRWKGSMSGADAFVRSYAVDAKPDASRWVAQFLLTAENGRSDVLKSLLRSPATAFRFVHHLALDQASLGAKARKASEAANVVVTEWLAILERMSEPHQPHSESALLVAGLLALAGSAGLRNLAPEVQEAVIAANQRLAVSRSITSLKAQEDGVDPFAADAWVVTSDALYKAVQRYLHNLPLSGIGDGTPERRLQLERYLGRKDVLVGIVESVGRSKSNDELREAIDAALFNAGVVDLGTRGEEAVFNVQLYETDASGVLPGDKVIIDVPTKVLGSGDNQVVLKKGIVTPFQS